MSHEPELKRKINANQAIGKVRTSERLRTRSCITKDYPQYVHCVMHKCIMVKLGGNEKHKACKNIQILKKQGENLKSRGNNNFHKIGGNVLKQRKQGEIPNLQSISKKRSSEIFVDENQKFLWEKVTFRKFSTEYENFYENRGEI